MTPEEAKKAILAGKASPNTLVRGNLYLGPNTHLSHLPDGLQVDKLELYSVKTLKQLPRRLRCRSLTIFDMKLSELPSDIQVRDRLILANCPLLKRLPPTLTVRSLHLSNCPELAHFPEEARIQVLLIQQCKKIETLPAKLRVQQLLLQDCAYLRSLPPGLIISDTCTIQRCPHLKDLPEQMHLQTLVLRDVPRLQRLPADLVVTQYLDLSGFPAIEELWSGLRLHTLVLRNCERLITLPADLRVDCLLDVSGCLNLEQLPSSIRKLYTLRAAGCLMLHALPPELEVYTLDIHGCPNLRSLPRVLSVKDLNISGCVSLTHWPDALPTGPRRLYMRGCTGLSSLPPGKVEFDQLDIGDCLQITELPVDLHITGWLDLANTSIRTLPPSAAGFKLRWHGVSVPGRLILHPETLTSSEILAEENTERRRAMIERLGMNAFLEKANPEVLDCDEDPGGQRWLLKVNLKQDEPLLCLQVQDPSTGREYLIRVPPTMRTCHQAAAWIAGFDNPKDYHPLVET